MGEAYLNLDSGLGEVSSSAFHSRAWYAVQTAYRSEQKVCHALSAKGFETYLPVLREIHQWTDRRKTIHVPAFSGYLFVRHEPTLHNRIRILETHSVVRLLGNNHAPNPVPEMEIEAVRRALSSSVNCQRCDELTLSSKVRVTRGPLAGIEGHLARYKNSLRLVITVSGVSQSISVEVGADDVEAIQDRSNAGQCEP